MTTIVNVLNLNKQFGNQKAVDDISFSVAEGEIVGFLGPNGAGKTTTIRMLLNLLTPTSGTIEIFGQRYDKNRDEILNQLNASTGTLTLPGKLTVLENLNVFADMYALRNKKKRIEFLLEKFELTELASRPLFSLSTGQQVRASFAKAFLNAPKLLLLDEPTASLDPDVADRLRTFLLNVVKESGTTVFVTSHNMGEVEMLCSRILFLKNGKIHSEGTPKALAEKTRHCYVRLSTKNQWPLIAPSERYPFQELDAETREYEVPKNEVAPFITNLIKQGLTPSNLQIKEPTLEDFFLQSSRGLNE